MDRVREAEDRLFAEFVAKARGMFSDICFLGVGNVSILGGFPCVEFFVQFGDFRMSVSLSLKNEDMLVLRWCGVSSVITNFNSSNDAQISQLCLLSRILQSESEWRKLLLSLDVGPLESALGFANELAVARSEKRKREELGAFDAAGIVVGTELVCGGRVFVVEQVSRTKVLVGRTVYSKQEVGKNILEGKWSVVR